MATTVKQKQATDPTTEKSSEDRVVESAKHFWERNSKFITYVVTGLVLVVGGYFAYVNFMVKPDEEKAEELIWKAQSFYKVDSFAKALNGDGQTQGFLRVVSRHGGTKAGNLAKFYAGVCYLKLGDFNNAVKYLKEFETDVPVLKVRAFGCLGDAYSMLGKKQEAIDNYTKAGNAYDDDDVNAPEYLYRAAMINADMGKTKEAATLLKQLKDKFPASNRAAEADKYLGKLGDLN
jgi:predicted negative regulator of RcsB-dependent stress response